MNSADPVSRRRRDRFGQDGHTQHNRSAAQAFTRSAPPHAQPLRQRRQPLVDLSALRVTEVSTAVSRRVEAIDKFVHDGSDIGA